MSQKLEQELRRRLESAPPAARGMAALAIPAAVRRAAGDVAPKLLSALQAVGEVASNLRQATELRLDWDEEHTSGALEVAGLIEQAVECGNRLAAALAVRASARGLGAFLVAAMARAEKILKDMPEHDWPGCFSRLVEEATREHLGAAMRDAMDAVEAVNREELVELIGRMHV